ncbi:MAG: MAPEG family protein [Gammaproteobacteria bacterium]
MAAPLTALYAALLALLLVVLGLQVVRTRIREKVSLGDGNNPAMLAAIRVHANAAETIPIALLLMLLLELNGGSAPGLHLAGITLLAGRVLHAWGLTRRRTVNRWRQLGMVLTWTVTIGLAVALLVKAWPLA